MTIQKQEEQRVKEHLTFTEIGKRLGRDRTAITKEVRNYSVEQDTGYSVFAHNICKYRKGCRRKKVCTHRFKPPYVCNGCWIVRRGDKQIQIRTERDFLNP